MQPTLRLLRHGAMPALFGGIRAPSTLGSFLRSFTWGNVLQLEKAGRELLGRLSRQAPLLPGADVLAFVDIDSTQKRVYGHRKEGARFGHTKIQGKSVLVRGLNALIGTVSTPLAAPVAAATRLRGGNAPSARGAASLAVQAVGTAVDHRELGTRDGDVEDLLPRFAVRVGEHGAQRFVPPDHVVDGGCQRIRVQCAVEPDRPGDVVGRPGPF